MELHQKIRCSFDRFSCPTGGQPARTVAEFYASCAEFHASAVLRAPRAILRVVSCSSILRPYICLGGHAGRAPPTNGHPISLWWRRGGFTSSDGGVFPIYFLGKKSKRGIHLFLPPLKRYVIYYPIIIVVR